MPTMSVKEVQTPDQAELGVLREAISAALALDDVEEIHGVLEDALIESDAERCLAERTK